MHSSMMRYNRTMPQSKCAFGRCVSLSSPGGAQKHGAPRFRRHTVCSVGQGTQGGYVPSTPDCNANALSGGTSISDAKHEAGGKSASQLGQIGSGFRPQPETQNVAEDKPSADELKAVLLDSLYGTERGLSASLELRGEISELISQLEAANPNTDDPNDARLLQGTWKLVYTAASELGALLALSRLPLVTVGDITQTIDVATGRVVNKVVLSDVFTRSAFSSTANFEVRSPKLLSIKFVSGALATPQLLQDIDLPQSITVLGQNVDLTAVREALSPARQTLQSAASQVSAFLDGRPDTKIDLPAQVQLESWLLTTYIDEDVRIARGDGGAVFVLMKEPPPAPTPAAPTDTTGFGIYGTGAWKDDPIGNSPPSVPVSVQPPLTTPLDSPPLTTPSVIPPLTNPSDILPSAIPTTDSPSTTPFVASPRTVPSSKPPSQEAVLPPQEAALLAPNVEPEARRPAATEASQAATSSTLNIRKEGRSANPGDTLGISLGQRKANKAKKKGSSKRSA